MYSKEISIMTPNNHSDYDNRESNIFNTAFCFNSLVLRMDITLDPNAVLLLF